MKDKSDKKQLESGKDNDKEYYHIYGSPWGGYAECLICGRQSHDYTTAIGDLPIWGFPWGWPLANIDGFLHSIRHRIRGQKAVIYTDYYVKHYGKNQKD